MSFSVQIFIVFKVVSFFFLLGEEASSEVLNTSEIFLTSISAAHSNVIFPSWLVIVGASTGVDFMCCVLDVNPYFAKLLQDGSG